jgi:phosphate starvation-inducible PhoH-like protein
MVSLLKTFTSIVILNRINMFKISSRCASTGLRKTYVNMKKDVSDLKSLANFYKPKTTNQEKYVKYLNSPSVKLLFAVGPAGTGKTMLACNHAIKELKDGNIQKIIITRPVVPVEEEDIGFLPGNINKKMDPWMTPIFDIFNEFYARKDIESMIYNNIIEVSPLAFMRGRTFKNSFVIADEMQNSSPNQMLMLTTRLGENSKMVITGDLKQSDRGINSGLYDFINKYKRYNNYLTSNNENTNYGINIIELTNEDIERSKVVSKILDIYNLNDNNTFIKNNSSTLVNNSTFVNNNSTLVNNNSTLVKENKNTTQQNSRAKSIPSYYINNDDAALIPIHHLSRNYK